MSQSSFHFFLFYLHSHPRVSQSDIKAFCSVLSASRLVFFFFFKGTRDVAITKLLFLGTIQRFTIAALQKKRQKLCSQLVPHRKPDWIFMLQYAIAQFYLTMLKVGNAAEQCEENRWIVTKEKWTPLHVGCTGRGRGMSECVDGHERLRGWEREMFGAALQRRCSQKRGWHKPRVICQNFFLLLPPFPAPIMLMEEDESFFSVFFKSQVTNVGFLFEKYLMNPHGILLKTISEELLVRKVNRL